jgi:hypothetical protein
MWKGFFMLSKALCGLLLLSGVAGATSAQALTLTPSSNIAAGFEWSVDTATRTIAITEYWNPGVGRARIKFDGLEGGDGWSIYKIVHNDTGKTWKNFEHELFNSDGSQSDDFDGLSFDQGGPIERNASKFSILTVDELATRDFLQWSGMPYTNSGEFAVFEYGIRDNAGSNSPFFLGQASNVPEPATWAMLIVGFGLVGFSARRRASAAGRKVVA